MTDLMTLALQWDPQIRGTVIVLTAIAILCGSVYLLLATNTGAKLGFLLALAGVTGWMFLMGIVWMLYGIGLKGRAPEWKVDEIVTGDLGQASTDALRDFPEGEWKQLHPGDAILGDAQAATDHILAPGAAAEGEGEGGGAPESEVRFQSPFTSTDDYVQVAGYRKGGETKGILPGLDFRPFDLKHEPHYVVIQVQPTVDQPEIKGQAPPRPVPDLTQPVTSVVLIRDLGNVRLLPFLFALANGIAFAVVVYVLHQRDKEIMAARAAATA